MPACATRAAYTLVVLPLITSCRNVLQCKLLGAYSDALGGVTVIYSRLLCSAKLKYHVSLLAGMLTGP